MLLQRLMLKLFLKVRSWRLLITDSASLVSIFWAGFSMAEENADEMFDESPERKRMGLKMGVGGQGWELGDGGVTEVVKERSGREES